MSLAQRVLFTWLYSLVFFTMLVLKLDGKVTWSWFIIFLPVWICDFILLLMLGLEMVGECMAGRDLHEGAPSLGRKAWYLMALVLKLGFCFTLCARLDHVTNLRPYYICIPLWIMLTGAMVELGANIFPQHRD